MGMMTPMAAAGQAQGRPQQARKNPFRYNTRRRFRSQAIDAPIPISFGGYGSKLLPPMGELNRVLVYCDAQFTDPAAAPSVSAAQFGPWNLIKRIKVTSNVGSSDLVNLSGYGAYLTMKSRQRNFDLTSGLTGVTNDDFYQFPTTFTQNQAKNVAFVLVLPVAANIGRNFGLGAVNLQAPEIRVSVEVTFGQLSDVYTTGDAVTVAGNVYVAYEYFEIPPPQRNVALPPLIAHRMLEERVPFSNTGDIIYTMPRMGKLLRAITTVTANGSTLTGGGTLYSSGAGNKPADGIDQLHLKLGVTDEVEQVDHIWARFRQRELLGAQELPAGSYLWEYWGAEGQPAQGDFRDQFDTEAITTFQLIHTINGAVTLGSNNNYIDYVREIWQPLDAQAAA